MHILDIDEKSAQMLHQLRGKFEPDGQSLSCHLEGLVHARYTSYWDYIQLNVLLNLQNPRTTSPDEMIFVTYHQITELYFKLILFEMAQVNQQATVDPSFFLERIRRINRYFNNLIYSFDIMVDGMDKEQFLQFRTALAPASGFQSYQYRLIEVCATGLHQLLAPSARGEGRLEDDTDILYAHIYWKEGAIDRVTRKKDLSLISFEHHYDDQLLRKARELNVRHFYAHCHAILPTDPLRPAIEEELRNMDRLMNVDWRLSHFRSASKHLRVQHADVKATGGTNWREYLPPRMQKIIFFPSLWSATEQSEWGRSYIEKLLE